MNLVDEEVNLSTISSINCNFQKGFKEIFDNNTFNKNDLIGKKVLLLLSFIIICLLIALLDPTLRVGTLYLSAIGSIVLIYNIIREPIYLLYTFSYLVSMNVRTPEFLDINEFFPNHTKFSEGDTFNNIKNECMNILAQKENLSFTRDTYGNDYIGGGNIELKDNDGWRIYVVKIGNLYKAENTMPVLTSVLKELPEVITCAVSILPKKKAIPIHVGYSKGVMRYQLAIKIPEDRENVFICVNGKKYMWTDGEGVLFDDTYPHKVYNNTEEDRMILYMDVVRPKLPFIIDKLNRFINNLVANSSIVRNEIANTEKQITIQ